MFAEMLNKLPPNEVNDHVDSTEGIGNKNNDTYDLETKSDPERNIHRCSSTD